MAVQITCPEGHRLKVDEKYLGRTIRCPKCKSEVLVEEVIVAEAVEVEPQVVADTQPFDSSDPLSNFFGSTDLPDSFATAPASANYSFPVASAPVAQAAVKTQASAKAGAQGIPKTWLIIGGVGGGLVLILAVGLLSVFFWSGKSSTASENWVLSQTLLDYSKALNEKAAANPDLNMRDLAPDWFEKEMARIREYDPEHYMLPESREAALKAGKPDPDAERLKQVALQAIQDVFGEWTTGPQPNNPNPPVVQSSLVLQLVLADWRVRLMHVDKVDEQKWEKMKKYEQELYGNHSIFNRLEKWDGKQAEDGHKLMTHLQSVNPKKGK